MDTYIGIIIPEGIAETQKKNLKLTDIEVKEYGYTQALLQLILKTVYLVKTDKVDAVSRINEEQQMLINRIGMVS